MQFPGMDLDFVRKQIASEMEKVESANRELARDNQARHEAILETASSLRNIHQDVSGIRTDLEKESAERKLADKETMTYTKKANNTNLAVAIISAVIALASLLVAFFK